MTGSWLDIEYVVNQACQFEHAPIDEHWLVVKRMLRHLKGSFNHGIVLSLVCKFNLNAYYDDDWAGNPDDRCSTTRFVILLGDNLLSWSSKKQPTVDQSI